MILVLGALRGRAEEGRFTSLTVSPDGKALASGSRDKRIKLWEVATGREIRTLSGHTGGVNALAFSPNGGILASSSDDKTVRLWDPATGIAHTFSGHTDVVFSMTFSPDGGLLASYMEIQLRDPKTGSLLRTLTGHQSYIYAVAFSPDGKTLASGADDQRVKMWSASALAALIGPAPGFSGTIMGSENLMVRNRTAFPSELKVANQGNVCHADFLFLVKE